MRAAHDAISRRANAIRSLEGLGEPRTVRPSEARPDRTTKIPAAPRGHRPRLVSYAKLTTRGGRTHARSTQGPDARGSCHARELVTRAATPKRESGVNPRRSRRPPMEGRTGRAPRNPVDEGAARSRVDPERSTGVLRGVPRAAHTCPRTRRRVRPKCEGVQLPATRRTVSTPDVQEVQTTRSTAEPESSDSGGGS